MTTPEPPEKRPDNRLQLTALGYEFALGMLVLGGLGWLADGALGWRDSFPALMVAGILLGFGWGVWRLVRRLGPKEPDPPR